MFAVSRLALAATAVAVMAGLPALLESPRLEAGASVSCLAAAPLPPTVDRAAVPSVGFHLAARLAVSPRPAFYVSRDRCAAMGPQCGVRRRT